MRRAGRRSPRQAAGFTLIEVLVVVVLIGALSAVALLSVGAVGRKDPLEDEARRRGMADRVRFPGRREDVPAVLDIHGDVVGQLPQLGDDQLLELFRHLVRTRTFEERCMHLQRTGRIPFTSPRSGCDPALDRRDPDALRPGV